MAIHDLLWACPRCGEDRGLQPHDGAVRCQQCATRYERVDGARIRASHPREEVSVRDAVDWLRRLPDPATLLDEAEVRPDRIGRSARVAARFVVDERPVRSHGRYLNRREVYGPETEGVLELALESLTLRPDGPGGPGTAAHPVRWPFDALTAIQASSRTLQVKGRGDPLASFRFLDDSCFLWERLLAAAIRRFYRRTGRGDVVELQPRIVVA